VHGRRDLIRKYEIKHENGIINGGNLGKFYRFVNSRLSNKSEVDILKDTNGVHIASDCERAELLNHYFCS